MKLCLFLFCWAPVWAASAKLAEGSKNIVVFYEPGRFCGWPANNGVWIWGNEILVGFELRTYKFRDTQHSFDPAKPSRCVLARSRDGGETWKVEFPDNFVGHSGKAVALTQPVRFRDPNFAMRVDGPQFFVSYDRGVTWQGPYKISGLPATKLTSRTDYLVGDDGDALVFMSAAQPEVKAGSYHDRAFCARTADGGQSFQFLSWMTGEPLAARSVMPATVRTSPERMVSALRRRFQDRCWIDIVESTDSGRNWRLLCKAADLGEKNGNPPSMVRLPDSRLCLTYGTRQAPFGIRAKVSADGGKSWSEEIPLRQDGASWDEGYTRTVTRPDGKAVTIYYYSTPERKEQHLEATIWSPAP